MTKTVRDGLKVVFNRPKLETFKRALRDAKRDELDQFKFEQHDYLVLYAEYLVEYLDAKLAA